jgi:hypothetical protein
MRDKMQTDFDQLACNLLCNGVHADEKDGSPLTWQLRELTATLTLARRWKAKVTVAYRGKRIHSESFFQHSPWGATYECCQRCAEALLGVNLTTDGKQPQIIHT